MTDLRVRSFTKRMPPAPGYLDGEDVRIQQLQERTRFGWRVLDEEEVPPHVLISLACLGDTGGWKSKFASLGQFGRDGEFKGSSALPRIAA